MPPSHSLPPDTRHVYMVLSPRALGYARLALGSLLANADEPLHLSLITDSADDREILTDAIVGLAPEPHHSVAVFAEDDLADAEASVFARLPNLRILRHGHPCWRKITDPLLIGTPGDELVLLDPDLLFPNRFRFEPTPDSGLLLMWQQPNCLLPPMVVRTALADVPLARHVDIGVSHWRLSPDLAELDWIDWLIGKLGGASLPRLMHVEAILWSAIAMRFGGGYLDPEAWVCWHRTQAKRLRRKLGASGNTILRSEDWSRMKCFHAGGEAKWWLDDAMKFGLIRPSAAQLAPTPVTPFVELTGRRYEGEQRVKGLIGQLGYYKLFGAASR